MTIDRLSEILGDLRASAVVTGRFALHAPWSINKPAVAGVPFRIGSGAGYYLRIEGLPAIKVDPGDIVLLPHGDRHVMASDLSLPSVPFDTLLAQKGIIPRFDTPLHLDAGGDGPRSDLYTAIIDFPGSGRHPLFSILPRLVHIREGDPAVAPWLQTTLRSFIEESMSQKPGWTIAATRLSDVLFVQIIRAHLSERAGMGANWVNALFDPKIGKAILEMWRSPGEDWTIPRLAELAIMSRSRFVARFTHQVGEAPIAHLTGVRMYNAAIKLSARTLRISEIATAVGYASEKAFARAFKRWAGVAPSAYAALERSPLDG